MTGSVGVAAPRSPARAVSGGEFADTGVMPPRPGARLCMRGLLAGRRRAAAPAGGLAHHLAFFRRNRPCTAPSKLFEWLPAGRADEWLFMRLNRRCIFIHLLPRCRGPD